MIAPRARVVLRRRRLLPTDGDVLLEVGDRVAAETVVARAAGVGRPVMVNVAQQLDLRPSEVPAAMLHRVGDAVAAGEPLARTRGLWGWLASTCTAPVGGSVAAVSPHTGQVMLETATEPLEVRAFLPGIVADVALRRGVTVTGWGALVPGVFGVGKERTGELFLAVRRPEAMLTGELVGGDLAGRVLVAGSLITADALDRAAAAGAVGIITGGIEASDLDRWLATEITVADTSEVAAPLTVVVLGGFGRVPMDRRAFALLAANEGRPVCVVGTTRVRAGAARPEVIVPLAADAALADTEAPPAWRLRPGSRVLVVREPWLGQPGRVQRMPDRPQVLENEARCLVAEVDLDAGETVVVPRANLEVLEPQEEPA